MTTARPAPTYRRRRSARRPGRPPPCRHRRSRARRRVGSPGAPARRRRGRRRRGRRRRSATAGSSGSGELRTVTPATRRRARRVGRAPWRAGCRRRRAPRRTAARRRARPGRRADGGGDGAGRPGEPDPVRPPPHGRDRRQVVVAGRVAHRERTPVGQPRVAPRRHRRARRHRRHRRRRGDRPAAATSPPGGRRERRPGRRRRARRRPGTPGRDEAAPAPAAPARRSPAGRPPARGPSCRAAASRSCGRGGGPGPPATVAARWAAAAGVSVPGSDVDDHRAGAIGGRAADGHRHRPERRSPSPRRPRALPCGRRRRPTTRASRPVSTAVDWAGTGRPTGRRSGRA